MKIFSTGDQKDIIEQTQHLPTPFLVIDLEQIRENIRQIRQALPQAALFYAVKCNTDPRVLATVQQMNAGFEIASISEAQMVLQRGARAERIICFHPVKSPDFLRFLHHRRIDVLAADSIDELDKLAAHAPGSRIVIRVSVPNDGSLVPLSRKFGAEPKQATELFRYAVARGLVPYGITIHVGSQCERLETWSRALTICQQVYRQTSSADVNLSLISLGGGLPASYTNNSLSLAAIGKLTNETVSQWELPVGCTISVEPGRAVVASAGTLIVTVIGLADRAAGSWAYIDAGVYHGLFEAAPVAGRIPYPITVKHSDRQMRVYNVGGPTCDGFDLPFERLSLPELRIGDRIAIRYAGAYTSAITTEFNGFSAPTVHYLEDIV